MILRGLFFLCFLFIYGLSEGQVLNLDWSHVIHPALRLGDMEVDPRGNEYLLSDEWNNRNLGISFSKLDSTGNFLWTKTIETYPSSQGQLTQDARAIEVDGNGNVIIIGELRGQADFDPSNLIFTRTSLGSDDVFIAKYDPMGNLLWVKTIGSVNEDACRSLLIDDNNDIVISGFFSDTVDFDPDTSDYFLSTNAPYSAFIAKYSNTGNFIWAKKIEGITNFPVNGIDNDQNNSIYFSGWYSGQVDFDPHPGRTAFLTSNGSRASFMCKFNSSGVFSWVNNFDGLGESSIISILLDSNDLFFGGSYKGTIDFDPSPSTSRNMNTPSNNYNSFFGKLDTSGSLTWIKSFVSTSRQTFGELTLDDNNNLFITGEFTGQTDFDPDTSTHNMNTYSYSSGDIFICKLDENANFYWSIGIGGSYQDGGQFIEVVEDKIYLAGRFDDVVDFDPGPGIQNLTSTSQYSYNNFTVAFSEQALSATDSKESQIIRLYPNPSSGEIYLDIEKGSKIESFTVSDLNGRVVYFNQRPINKVSLNLQAGIYIVDFILNKERYSQKVILVEH